MLDFLKKTVSSLVKGEKSTSPSGKVDATDWKKIGINFGLNMVAGGLAYLIDVVGHLQLGALFLTLQPFIKAALEYGYRWAKDNILPVELEKTEE